MERTRPEKASEHTITEGLKKIQIRQATVEDARAIVDAEREIAEELGYFCSEPSELLLENVVNTIVACRNGNGVYLVAETNGNIVGHAFLELHHVQSLRHVADLNIAVHAGWQKRGIGTKLLRHIIEWAQQTGAILKIQLNVRASNFPAISLYKKMGFEEEGRLKNRVKVKDGYIDDIIMGLSLIEDRPQVKDVLIRTLEKKDINLLISKFCFPWSTIQATTDKWNQYFQQQQKQVRTVYVLEKEKEIIGYASLLYSPAYPHFKNAAIPEINDVWIIEEWRHQGLGKMFILRIEDFARLAGYQKIGIGVGLYADYGTAQKLYFRLGYIPDGYGITYNNQPVSPGETYPVDDELILWMTKTLR
ncbi:MAG: acetyltransferase, family [Chlamydiia bacterium]|nr:acetyltransferase, family [Chlamydiia bacterium]